jgi:prevent-host-death family protein
MAIINIYEAKTHLSKLVERALAGEEVVIAKAGRPLVKLTPYTQSNAPRAPGGWEGKVRMREDFDDELPPELLKAFYGTS